MPETPSVQIDRSIYTTRAGSQGFDLFSSQVMRVGFVRVASIIMLLGSQFLMSTVMQLFAPQVLYGYWRYSIL
jgi:hypothetical protein